MTYQRRWLRVRKRDIWIWVVIPITLPFIALAVMFIFD